jgi:lambda repressor-like predicted transcriptional regulator
MKMSEVSAWFEVWQRRNIFGNWLDIDHHKGEEVVKHVCGISDRCEIWCERYW